MTSSTRTWTNPRAGSLVRRGLGLVVALAMAAALFGVSPARAATSVSFAATELLGIPTDTSIVVNVVPDSTINLYYEYGTTSGVYTAQTGTEVASGGSAHETKLSGLNPDTRYYYRMRYQVSGDGDWNARPEYTFHTARASGEEFVFTITSDTHLDHLGTPSRWEQATYNIENDQPDFSIDLGDAFVNNNLTSQSAVDQKYLNQRDYFQNFSHSSALFLALGNHEDEEGWNFDDTFSLALASIKARKAFYPTPAPDATDDFYTANSDTLSAIGGDNYREDYYAWEWGDALFVVIDPFQYTMELPYAGGTAGEGTDDATTGDQWSWTLGYQQYDWLRTTLENSDAEFKFVFSHQVTGGQLDVSAGGGGPGYVRGGSNAAPYFEWGGRDASGTYVFDTMRPGWGDPIHQIMVDNGVTAYFHGHDHQFAYEIVDGIVYQELPSPTMTGSGFNLYSESDPDTIKVLPNSGHLRVTISPDANEATVEYVRSDSTVPGTNGVVSYTYTMDGNETGGGDDTTAPVITLLGANPMTIEAGSTFTDPGAQVTDNLDPTVTIYGTSTVNASVPGDYTVTYNHSDAAGNPGATVVRTVHVVDTTAPVISLLGSNPISVSLGGTFTDPGALVTDNVDATTTVYGTSNVNPNVAGNYTVTYNHTDTAGNHAAQVTRTVNVVDGSIPPVDTFSDDDGLVFEADIEWLAATGITRGCNPPINDMYCPADPTTRGQMAAFFHRALGSVLTVDLADANVFTDTAGSTFEADIAWLSAAGITQGCNPPENDLYCAATNVTRGQMAAFLHRGFGSLIGTPASSGLTFTDTATSVFAADIQWLVDAGITKGCGPDTYCPNDLVTRGQMAAFFHRAYQAAGL